MLKSLNGLVNNNSKVPERFSSENIRMVTAGTRKRNTQGAMIKRVSRLAYPLSSTFNSPGKIQIKKLFARRNTIITKYPVSVLKNELISFLNRANIV